MAMTTAVNMEYSHFNSQAIFNEQRLNKSSSPALHYENFLYKRRETATQPTQSKQAYTFISVDGQPFVIGYNTESQLEKSLDNTAPQSAVALIERLNLIKSSLALSVTQLAELFGVTRKAIYDWYDGAEPRSVATTRMELLIDILNKVPEELDMRRLKAVWHIPVSEKSFLAVFGDDKLAPHALRADLKKKLDELSPRLVATTKTLQKTTTQFGEAHLAEFDRRTDFG
jgi:DNA-binding transcriptional regulator YiaG